jgi:hypothetical protein
MSKLPKFICVGAQKAGTTWLYKVLSEHSEVFLPRIKELLHFIDVKEGESDEWRHRMILDATIVACNQYIHDERTTLRPGFAQYILSYGAHDRFTDAWYERIYSAAADDAVSGDITPEYMMMGAEGIARVKALLGEVKIVLILRDPVERLWSQVRMVSKELGRDPVEAYWDVSREYACEKNSDYATYVPIWLDHTDPSNLGIFNFHALARDPSKFHQDILEFLELSHEPSETAQQVVHQGVSSPIPDDILKDMQSFLAPQNQYLIQTFGESWSDSGSRLHPFK